MKTHEQYVCAILQNPEWFKTVVARYGNGETVGTPQIATAILNLHNDLADRLDVDEDVSEDSPEDSSESDQG